MKEGFGALHPQPCWTDHDEMSLLRSFSTRVARVAINMALLTELFAAPAAHLLCERCE